MLRSNSKSLGNHVVIPEEEKERLQWEGLGQLRTVKMKYSKIYRYKLRSSQSNLPHRY